MKMSKIEKVFVNSPSHSTRVSAHAERLLKQIPFEPGQRYLDVGCGNGAAPIHLAKKFGLNVVGVDVDPGQIQEAKRSGRPIENVEFITLDGVQLPFEDGEFDIVATNKVMHHIPDWERAFMELQRVLAPGGYLIFSDLVFPPWFARLGNQVVGSRVGFPSQAAIEALVRSEQFLTLLRAPSLGHYEAIFQRTGSFATGAASAEPGQSRQN